jgi:hypothetical protein
MPDNGLRVPSSLPERRGAAAVLALACESRWLGGTFDFQFSISNLR